MEKDLNQIITHGATPEQSIDTNLLNQHTKKITGAFSRKLRWNMLTQLYIFDFNRITREQLSNKEDLLQPGAYTDVSGEWCCIFVTESQKVQEYISRCTSSLEILSVRFSSISELDVGHLTGLKELTLDNNQTLVEVRELKNLSKLAKLDLTNTGVGPVLNLNDFPLLAELRLDRTFISYIHLTAELTQLRAFHARYSNIEDADFLRFLPAATTVDLANTKISKLPLLDSLHDLEQLYLSGTQLTVLPSLKEQSKLQMLSLSSTPIVSLEGIEFPAHLNYLDLSGIGVQYLPESIGKLQELQTLDLSEMHLNSLPEWFPNLNLEFSLEWGSGIRLRNTIITGVDMTIFSQPRDMVVQWFRERRTTQINDSSIFLPNSKYSASRGFCPSKSIFSSLLGDISQSMVAPMVSMPTFNIPILGSIKYGKTSPIDYLDKLHIASLKPNYHRSYEPYRQNIDIIKDRQPQGVHELDETPAPLNEIKVVFLGDGESGKSHTIARLLKNGEQAEDFPGVSTPGIVIQDMTYEINGNYVQVHFWDFGGQEILHSMHRMFLTTRTLYVVLLNVREGNQDERARYWLHNIRSFANGAPVLLVLNKMDMNRNASVNENDLRTLYPKLTDIVKMSALTDSADSIRNNLIAAMKRSISDLDILESPFLPAWNRLKEKLRTMTTPYIRGKEYSILSEECGVEKNELVRKALLKWFSDLGISFHYGDSAKLEDYVVLRPDWITNAVYIIIFNKIDEVKNGLVSHEAIYHLLHPSPEDASRIKRAVPETIYQVEEVEYVLNVIRKFRLSFQVDDGMEFMPMLCDGNSTKIAREYSDDPLALEFRMEYDYLPNNVLHRLMVERHRDLDQNNVWLTGARFVYGNTGLSAVVKSEGNLLRVMVRAEKPRYTADMYLDLLKEDLERINNVMGLSVKEQQVIYKADGITECIDYDDILTALEVGDSHLNSKIRRKKIPIQDILRQTNYHVDENKKQLILDIARACEMMQANKDNWVKDEDGRTTYIRDILTAKKYIVHDQHRSGRSEEGKKSGQLDLDIRIDADVDWTIFEALNIRGKGKAQLKNWDQHLRKVLDYYNAIGMPFLFHVSYVECPKDKFLPIYKAFYAHLNTFSPTGFNLQPQFTKETSLSPTGYSQNRFIQAVECVYDCGGASMTVYHYFVRVGE